MDRIKIIGRIRGPFPDGNLTWKFEGHRKPRHSLKTYVGRRYVLKYDPASRTFKVRCYRRLSKRNKKEAVESAAAMIPFLKARLSTADIARCTAASIMMTKQQSTVALDPSSSSGWAMASSPDMNFTIKAARFRQ
jgi:hypothetical protein